MFPSLICLGNVPVTEGNSPAQQLLLRTAQLASLERQATEVNIYCLKSDLLNINY